MLLCYKKLLFHEDLIKQSATSGQGYLESFSYLQNKFYSLKITCVWDKEEKTNICKASYKIDKFG